MTPPFYYFHPGKKRLGIKFDLLTRMVINSHKE